MRFKTSILTVKILLGLALIWPCAAKATVSFSPGLGRPGSIITVTGTGFVAGTTTNVWFNHATLADFDFVSATQLRVVIPPDAQSGPITVNAANSSTSNFLVAPRIDSFTPETQSPTNLISITGANFITGLSNTMVTFQGTNGFLSVTSAVVSANQLVAKVPIGASNGPIKIATIAGTAVSTNIFFASTRPVITNFDPIIGTNGTTVLISGANFAVGTVVKFGTVIATPVTIVSLSQLSVKVPVGATTAPITITNAGGGFTTSSNFITGSQPIITDFSPSFGTAGSGVTITGFNLLNETAVKFNGTAINQANITGKAANQLNIVLPAGLTTGAITVVNPSGSATTSNLFLASGPVISEFSPTVGAPGSQVVIHGINFSSGGINLKFNTVAASYSLTSDTQITATVPAGGTTGPLIATQGTNVFTTSSNFTVTGSAPAVLECSPATGVRGTLVTITGKNFISPVGVKFNGSPAIVLTPADPGTVKAYVPTNATSGPITVTNASGSGTSTFNFYIQPRVDSITPTNGIVNHTFTINGRNMTNATSVTVNGTPYAFSVMATQLVATIPTNATTGTVVVTTPAGTITSDTFSILPKIYSFSPNIGPAGTVVTIDGTSLFNVSSVQFGTGASATPTIVGTNELQVSVPAGSVKGPLTVTTPYGTDTSSNTFTFTTASELVLSKTVTPTYLTVGQNLVYTLVLTNKGPSINTGVVITDNLPNPLTFISATSTLGTCSYTNGTIVCNIGVMNTNTSVTLTVNATAWAAAGVTNTALATQVEPDLNVDNNFAFAFAYIVDTNQRTLSITKLTNQPKAVISWPASAINFELQYNTNLNNPTNWQVPDPGPNTNGPIHYFTNDLLAPQKFFRLKSP